MARLLLCIVVIYVVRFFCSLCQAKRSDISEALQNMHKAQIDGLCAASSLKSWARKESWSIKQMLSFVRLRAYRSKDFSRTYYLFCKYQSFAD